MEHRFEIALEKLHSAAWPNAKKFLKRAVRYTVGITFSVVLEAMTQTIHYFN